MKRDVENWYRQCDDCARGKCPPLRPHGHLQKIQVGAPLDLVTMDVLSGLPTATDGSKYVLVVVDAFTKCVEAYALPGQETHLYDGVLRQVRPTSSAPFRSRPELRVRPDPGTLA